MRAGWSVRACPLVCVAALRYFKTVSWQSLLVIGSRAGAVFGRAGLDPVEELEADAYLTRTADQSLGESRLGEYRRIPVELCAEAR
jgi:hypothetical protein